MICFLPAHGAMWSSILHIFLLALCQAPLAAGGTLFPHSPIPRLPPIRTFGAVERAWMGELEWVHISLCYVAALLDLRQVTEFSRSHWERKGTPTITGTLWPLPVWVEPEGQGSQLTADREQIPFPL